MAKKRLKNDANGTIVTILDTRLPSKKKKCKVRNYVYKAEEQYGVRRYFVNMLNNIPARELVKLLYLNTVLSNNELAWLLDTDYQAIKDMTKKVSRPKQTSDDDENPQKGKMTAEYLRKVAMFGISELFGDIGSKEEDVLDLQKSLAIRGMKMMELETSDTFGRENVEKYSRMFDAIAKGSALWKDSIGVLNTKDKAEIDIKKMGHEMKQKQLDLEAKGKNVAITIMEEYGENSVLSDHDLIYMVSDFLRKLGHDDNQIQDINKVAMATIHHKRGNITDEELKAIQAGEKPKFNDIAIN